MIRADTRPTVITMTAELLCKMAVKIIPAINPKNGVEVIFLNNLSIAPPESLNRLVRNNIMPSKKQNK